MSKHKPPIQEIKEIEFDEILEKEFLSASEAEQAEQFYDEAVAYLTYRTLHVLPTAESRDDIRSRLEQALRAFPGKQLPAQAREDFKSALDAVASEDKDGFAQAHILAQLFASYASKLSDVYARMHPSSLDDLRLLDNVLHGNS